MSCHALLGYTLFDSCVLYAHRHDDAFKSGVKAFAFHHFVTVIGWAIPCLFGVCHNVATPMLLTEGTSPFVNGRYFLSKAGFKETLLYKINGVLILVLWIVLRIIYIAWVAYSTLWTRQAAGGVL